MIEEEMKVGPKGQVVIPRVMRKALNIHPGSKVVFRLEDNRAIIEKQETDAVAVFEKIARSGGARSTGRVSVHAYEEELEERNEAVKRG